jgi:hypothetical protein
MKVNSDHKAVAERLGEGVFFDPRRNVFSLLVNKHHWEIILLEDMWDGVQQYNLLALDEKYLIKLPKDKEDVVAMLELWKAHQEGVVEMGRCTPSACCPSHAAQQQIDLETEKCPVTMLAGSLIAAREVADEESVTGFFTDAETNDMYKVVIQYIGNRSND